MFSVVVKHSARKRLCSRGFIWVKDKSHDSYVSMKDRGLWSTREEAAMAITEPFEMVVEI